MSSAECQQPAMVSDTSSSASESQTYCLYTICGVDVRNVAMTRDTASDLIETAKTGNSKGIRAQLIELGGEARKKQVHRNYRRDPEPVLEHDIVEQNAVEIGELASFMTEEANESIELARELRRRVIEYGGISKSSYERIPVHYRRRDGYALDCLATELGYADEDALYLAIQGAENVLRRLPVIRGKRVKKYRQKDFIDTAEACYIDYSADEFEDVPF